ncbi:MAG: SYNERG-CTERM system CAAX-type protease, partial [Fretibacterium sp.]|nr:SYNERG-CTERM system CAAX-type protease [Fretibacterium sp.]
MNGLAAALLGLAVGAFMLYFPYWWCGTRGEREEDWGLAWF